MTVNLVVPASATATADKLLELVDPLLDQFQVKSEVARKRHQRLIVTAMAEALRAASPTMLHDKDREELRWLSDALLITVGDEISARWKERLAASVGLVVIAVLCVIGLLATGDRDVRTLAGFVAIVTGLVGCMGLADLWHQWRPSIGKTNDR